MFFIGFIRFTSSIGSYLTRTALFYIGNSDEIVYWGIQICLLILAVDTSFLIYLAVLLTSRTLLVILTYSLAIFAIFGSSFCLSFIATVIYLISYSLGSGYGSLSGS